MTAVTVSSPADHGCESHAAVRPLAFGLAGFFAKDWSMQIPLGHGRFAEIDEDVFCLVQQYKWRLLGGPNARWQLAKWSAEKLHESTVICRVAGVNPLASDAFGADS